jgi:hypothetical protein
MNSEWTGPDWPNLGYPGIGKTAPKDQEPTNGSKKTVNEPHCTQNICVNYKAIDSECLKIIHKLVY